MQVLGGIAVALLLLGLMVTLHELGHFLMGLKLGFKVVAFQIFVGPKLVEWERKGIQYRICLLPLGAAVQFAGEFDEGLPADGEVVPEAGREIARSASRFRRQAVGEPVSNPDPRAFHNRPKSARAAVLLAGPAMNLLTGILALFICFAMVGYTVPVLADIPAGSQADRAGLEPGDRIICLDDRPIRTDVDVASAFLFKGPESETTVRFARAGKEHELSLLPEHRQQPMLGIQMQVEQDGLIRVVAVDASSNGGQPVLQAEDRILAVNGKRVTAETVGSVLQESGTAVLKIDVVRDGEELSLETRPTLKDTVNPIGLALLPQKSILPALPYSISSSWSILKLTGRSVAKMLVGQLKATEALSGPVGIVNMISDVVTAEEVTVKDKAVDLLRLFSLISLSLGFTNLLPIPLLDGNQLLLLGVEAVRGKRLSYRVQSIISLVGIVFIFALFALALYADLARLFIP